MKFKAAVVLEYEIEADSKAAATRVCRAIVESRTHITKSSGTDGTATLRRAYGGGPVVRKP